MPGFYLQPERYNHENSQFSEHAEEEATNEQDGVKFLTNFHSYL